jgi:hypothetical protein
MVRLGALVLACLAALGTGQGPFPLRAEDFVTENAEVCIGELDTRTVYTGCLTTSEFFDISALECRACPNNQVI